MKPFPEMNDAEFAAEARQVMAELAQVANGRHSEMTTQFMAKTAAEMLGEAVKRIEANVTSPA